MRQSDQTGLRSHEMSVQLERPANNIRMHITAAHDSDVEFSHIARGEHIWIERYRVVERDETYTYLLRDQGSTIMLS